MSGLDSRYVTSPDLEEYFVSNQNGEALAGGIVTFYKDNARTEAKDIFQLTQDPMTGAYSYAALPNPMTLSGVGTPQDSGGNNVAIYYYPFDQFGNQELYYITVYDAFGNLQFTREAWPFPNSGTGGGGGDTQPIFIGPTNQLSNPQFAVVNFIAPTLTIQIAGAGTTTIAIAPDWDLTIVATGASSVSLTQTPIVGQLKLPYNPPFTLDFAIGANITSVKLIQTLHNNPDWAAPQVAGTMGYLSGSILLGNGTSVNMQYVPSVGATQTILNVTNNSGQFVQEAATVALVAANNTDTGATGYDQIVINIIGTAARISNVQVIPLTTNTTGIQYDQTPVNRQIDHLFNYYNPLLQFKPIPSYLVGWDFALNPAQFLGPGTNMSPIGPFATGDNTSNYVWDQTIVFQSKSNGFTAARGGDGGLFLTSAVDNVQLALIQYIEPLTSNGLLYEYLSVMVKSVTSVTAGVNATVSLWYTAGSLPSTLGANNSIVATLDANGKPATFHGTWIEIPRLPVIGGSATTQNASFTIQTAGTQDPTDINNIYPFSGWAPVNVGTGTYYMAIVVGTAPIANNKEIGFQSISLQKGKIPTIPGAQSLAAVLADCQRYYEKSFDTNEVPQTNAGTDTGEDTFLQAVGASTGQNSGTISYKVSKWKDPDLISFYNPNANNSEVRNQSTNTDCTASTLSRNSFNGFALTFTTPGGSGLAQLLAVHWTSDARLGQ